MTPKYVISNCWNNQMAIDASLEIAIEQYEDEYGVSFQDEIKEGNVKVYGIGNEVQVSFEMKVVHVPKVAPPKVPAKKTSRKIN